MAMIVFRRGNIFDAEMQVLVNPVNCKGVMGKGLAWQFAHKYPEILRDYEEWCRYGCHTGDLYFHKSQSKYRKSILDFPTKDDWRQPSHIAYIKQGLHTFAQNYQKMGITSIAFPPLGCGEGRLEWSEVRALMIKKLTPLENLVVEIYEQ